MSKIEKALHKATEQRKNSRTSYDSNQAGSATTGEITKSHQYTKTLVQSSVSLELLERERLLGGDTESELTDKINLLRTQVLQKTRSMGWTTIMVTSPNAGAGKTTISTNLAISLARELNHTALLVDISLQKSAVAKRLGISEVSGLSDYLLQNVPLENLLINPGIDKLVVLPAGTQVQNSAELLGSSNMKKLVSELKHRYADRYIIFDAPPIVDQPDALVFSEYVDAIILVVSDSETNVSGLKKSIELLSNRNILGIVLNKVR